MTSTITDLTIDWEVEDWKISFANMKPQKSVEILKRTYPTKLGKKITEEFRKKKKSLKITSQMGMKPLKWW